MAVAALTDYYAKEFPKWDKPDILDACASHVSHFPADVADYAGNRVGVGMNEQELGENGQIDSYVVRDLNEDPTLPFPDDSFDMVALGQDPALAHNAGYYARVLAISIPAQIVYSQLLQFFSSQRIMQPQVTASSFGFFSNLALGLIFVLGVYIPNFSGYRFAACPIVTTAVIYIQIVAMWYFYCFRQGLHKAAWDGWSPREITFSRLKIYLGLYVPAALATASDFWRMGIIGKIAADMGPEEVGVFYTSYRIIWITLIFSSAVGGAMSIKVGNFLGKGQPQEAKNVACTGIAIIVSALAVQALIFGFKLRAVVGVIFTNDEDFLDAFDEAKWPFLATLVFMNLAVVVESILMSMGRTSVVFWMGFFGSWLGESAVPRAFLTEENQSFSSWDLIIFLFNIVNFNVYQVKYPVCIFSQNTGDLTSLDCILVWV